MTGPVQLTEARRDVAFEAAYELEALGRHLAQLSVQLLDNSDTCDLGRLIRCISGRTVQLSGVVMSCLDGEDDTDERLRRRVMLAD